MALGVLNNLSAIYAENYLNNTNSSLQTVLQQLSSGSRINSGADDAAGLSLVNGLQANSDALTQSSTNATEGVGLLQVADGAMSQVTNLLNRAVTLATEASNGTLNASQEAAANQEYQSILAEINNIGSTTTYNQQQVFNGATVSIYTGDSSTQGSSIDNLNLRTLSESSIGDTAGAMSYGTGASQGTVFIDLSNGGSAVSLNDYLDAANPGAAATMTVTSLTSTGGTATTVIATGGTTGYLNTVSGMITAINNAGLGLTASLTTGNIAGLGSANADGGIMITGSVGVGTSPSAASFSGALAAGGATTDSLAGSITIQAGSGVATQITMAQVAQAEGSATLANLKSYLNSDAALGVTVTGTTTLTLTSTNGSTAPLSITSNLTDTTAAKMLTYSATSAYSEGIKAATTIFDATSGQLANDSVITGASMVLGNTATISYSDKAGQSLSSTDLTTQGDAQMALNQINLAITDVAALDGYIGAQINTLNSISQVMTTQQENIVSAQNAIQATDYASATSNMSKYEILSQTGIAALAQANSVQQEVTKLLQ